MTAVPEKYVVAEPPSTPGLVAAEASTARSSVVVSASVVLVSAFGGALAVLIALIAGEGPRTDGFLAAYAAYLTLILFGSTLRVALVPLLGPTGDEAAFRATAAASVARLIAAGALVCAVLGSLSPLLGRALVPGAPAEAQFTAAVSVAVLALAAWAQIWAAALSAVLSASRRFASSAILYSAVERNHGRAGRGPAHSLRRPRRDVRAACERRGAARRPRRLPAPLPVRRAAGLERGDERRDVAPCRPGARRRRRSRSRCRSTSRSPSPPCRIKAAPSPATPTPTSSP